MARRGWCGAFGLLFVLSVCPRAAAQPRVAIEWVAPSDCGPETVLIAEIERLLGRSLDDATTSLRARVEILPGPPWTMRLVIETADGPAGERRLEGDTCREVAAAAAIVLALAIDPTAAERIAATPAVPPPGTVEPTPRADPPVTPPGPLVRPPPPRRRQVRAPRTRPGRPRGSDWGAAPSPGAGEGRGEGQAGAARGPAVHVSAFAGAGLALGTVPGVGAVGLAGAALSLGRFRVEASFLYTLPSEERLDDGRAGGGRFDLLSAGVDGCVAWAFGRWEPRGCIGAELGSLRGSAFGVTSPGEGDSLWLAARATGGLAWSPVPAFRLWLALSGIVPIERPRFVVEGRGAVFRPAVASGRALLGVELRFR